MLNKISFGAGRDERGNILFNLETYQEVLEIIKKTVMKCKRHQGIILTESDLKCYLYKDLFRRFGIPTCTLDRNILANYIHTEVPWYDENGKLTLRPDITILDPKKLSIKHGVYSARLPSKSFEFDGKAIIIEIKFFRSLAGIIKNNYDEVKCDIEKMIRLFQINNGSECNVYGVLVVMSKAKRGFTFIKQLREEFQAYENIKIIYGSLDVNR